jgi:N-methylhydantoinase A
VHGAGIAAELGIRRIVVPRDSSIFCAAGMLRTDLKHDYVRSFAQLLPSGKDARVQALLTEMAAQARKTLDGEGIPRSRQRLRISMDMRYLGQYHEVNVPLPEKWDWKRVRELFHAQHDRLYGYSLREEGTAVVLLNIRLTAIGVTKKPRLAREPRRKVKALKGKRPVYLPERKGFATVPVYDGDHLGHGNRLAGPAVIESVNTSILVPPRHTAEYDALGNCILTVK